MEFVLRWGVQYSIRKPKLYIKTETAQGEKMVQSVIQEALKSADNYKDGVLYQKKDLPPVKNDLMIRVAQEGSSRPNHSNVLGRLWKNLARPWVRRSANCVDSKGTRMAPVWAMRQAGRYLPEFREMRKHHDFFQICNDPTLASEVTIQPLNRYPELDALVVFSDIMVTPQAVGLECVMNPGPTFPNPLKTVDDLQRVDLKPPAREKFRPLADAITMTRERIDGSVPVIGFCGAPWTLMGYMIEGRTDNALKWLYNNPEGSHTLLSGLCDVLIALLLLEYEAGADILQVFESSAVELTPRLFEEFSLPYLRRIAREIRKHTPAVQEGGPVLTVFARGAHYAFEALGDTEYNTISVDWSVDPISPVDKVGCKTLQGNLHPHALYASHETIRENVRHMISRFGDHPLIGNLGHGMLKDLDPEHFGTFITAVHEESAAYYAGVDRRKRLVKWATFLSATAAATAICFSFRKR
eukprot:gb/GECG01009851.1/.p1 GENE.gb/GECG01009851.1/~~gb/GECG01009851.1/.p1  ORF type:complete len:469 (+),score=40.80 gb/GECG01009851.1/:1-1407(+)